MHIQMYKYIIEEIVWAQYILNLIWYNPSHNYKWNLACSLQTKAFKNFSSERDLNPRPSDNMSTALPSELSGHVDIISSIII